MLDLRQRRRDNPEQHHIRTGNEMKDLNDASLDFNLVIDCHSDGRISVRTLDYRPGERKDQAAIASDCQTSTLLIMHQLDH